MDRPRGSPTKRTKSEKDKYHVQYHLYVEPMAQMNLSTKQRYQGNI